MSGRSRERLARLWTGEMVDPELRERAFRLWAVSATASDLSTLRSITQESPLFDHALRARMSLGDRSTFPDVQDKLRQNQHKTYWWHFCRYVWSDEFEAELDLELSRRGATAKGEWPESHDRCDWITSELLVAQVDDLAAEGLLEKHWAHLRFSPHFVQAALLIGTPRTRALAAQSLGEAPDAPLLGMSITI